MMKKLRSVLLALLFWGALWVALSAKVNSEVLLPNPLTVLTRLFWLCQTSAFWTACALTLVRILLGVVLAVLTGVLLSFLTHRLWWADAVFSPLLTVVKSTPVASFIVLLLVWLGRQSIPTVISVLMVTPVVWGNLTAGLNNVDADLLQMAKVYGVPGTKVLWGITLPSLKPYFFSALRTSLGLAWKAGIAAEVLTVPKNAIGTYIFNAKLELETADLFAWTLCVILLSLFIEKLLVWLVDRWGARK